MAPVPNPSPAARSLRATIGGLERSLALEALPFTIGRRPTHSLSIPLPQVSRDHAQIVAEGADYVLHDLGSTHGTLLNGAKLAGPRRLAAGDVIEFPNCPGVRVQFDPPPDTASLFLSQMHKLDEGAGAASEFDRLRLLLDFGQRLRAADGLEDILAAMLDAALRLTGAERGFVFLRPEGGGELHLATGRSASGATLNDDRSISHSIVEKAGQSTTAFLMNDSRQADEVDLARSVVEQDLRTVVAVPLREGVGVLYLDSHAASPALGQVSREMLDLLANEAAQVVINAQLARRQEEARLAHRAMEKELALAASIQQGLMGASLPRLGFARLEGLSQACLQIGGDFFDAVVGSGDNPEVALVLADVSGKGAAAALLAASLQGIVHAQLLAGMPLARIASMANRFICQRLEGEKYATLLIARLWPSGEVEYLNCGHIPPLAVGAAGGRVLDHGNMPVGLLPMAEYSSATDRLAPGERLLLVTDGVTEAANPAQEMFGDARLEDCLRRGLSIAAIADEVRAFCQGAPLGDDLTLLEARFAPEGPAA
ncbi:MAG TPA: SpoIIE family protein phosphatase [Terriglobales bacterium]|nr:SpoIIE family protein phosphatase [Terriglobales bacterium]